MGGDEERRRRHKRGEQCSRGQVRLPCCVSLKKLEKVKHTLPSLRYDMYDSQKHGSSSQKKQEFPSNISVVGEKVRKSEKEKIRNRTVRTYQYHIPIFLPSNQNLRGSPPKHAYLNSREFCWIIPVSLGIIQPSEKVRTSSDLRERAAQSQSDHTRPRTYCLYNLWYTQHVGLDTT